MPLVGRGGWKGSLTACGGKNVAIGGPMQSGTGSGFLGKQCLPGKTARVQRSSGDAEQRSENGGKFHPGFRWGGSLTLVCRLCLGTGGVSLSQICDEMCLAQLPL